MNGMTIGADVSTKKNLLNHFLTRVLIELTPIS